MSVLSNARRVNNFYLSENAVRVLSRRDQNMGTAEQNRKRIIPGQFITWHSLEFHIFNIRYNKQMISYIKEKCCKYKTYEKKISKNISINFLIYEEIDRIREKYKDLDELPKYEVFLDYIFIKTAGSYDIADSVDSNNILLSFRATIPQIEKKSKNLLIFRSSVKRITDEIGDIKLFGL